jgi:hypothetical protein
MPDMINEEEYQSEFPSKKGSKTTDSIREEALKNALDIRKFEIDLYWKRAGYFWAFIAVAFTGYFAILIEGEKHFPEIKGDLLLVASGIGLFMSLCWFCVNKGSKYWQENWEKHVDWLEDDVMGPLYKRVLAYRHGKAGRFWPTKPYPFSVSKINQLLSFAICLVWLFLYGTHFIKIIKSGLTCHALMITGFLAVLIFVLFTCCKTGCYKESDIDKDIMHKR